MSFEEEVKIKLSALSDRDLIKIFNKEVDQNGWGSSRATFLACLHKEIENRNYLDSSLIIKGDGMSMRSKVFLVDETIFSFNIEPN